MGLANRKNSELLSIGEQVIQADRDRHSLANAIHLVGLDYAQHRVEIRGVQAALISRISTRQGAPREDAGSWDYRGKKNDSKKQDREYDCGSSLECGHTDLCRLTFALSGAPLVCASVGRYCISVLVGRG